MVVRLLLAGCLTLGGGPAAPCDGPGDWRLCYHLEGGDRRFDVVFEVGTGGLLTYDRRHPEPMIRQLQVDDEVLGALERLVERSGFRCLSSGPGPKSADRRIHRYTIAWRGDDGVVTRVVGADGEPLPEAFRAVREAVGALQRRVRREGAPPP